MTKSKEESLRNARKYRDQLKRKRSRQSRVQRINGSNSRKKKEVQEEARRKAKQWAKKNLSSCFDNASEVGAEESSLSPETEKPQKPSSVETLDESFKRKFDDMSIGEDARNDREEGTKKDKSVFTKEQDRAKPQSRSTEDEGSAYEHVKVKCPDHSRTKFETSYSFSHKDGNTVNLAADRRKVDKEREQERKAAEQARKHREEELSARKKYEAEQAEKRKEQMAEQAEKRKEQANAVNTVLRSYKDGDLYGVLCLSKDAVLTQSEVTKAYRRLAVKIHPDKCLLPNADEAFKAINEANAVLSCPTERAKFDRIHRRNNASPRRDHSRSSFQHFCHGSTQYNTFKSGTRVTVQTCDSSFHSSQWNGTIVGFNQFSKKYRVISFRPAHGREQLVGHLELFQNVNVTLLNHNPSRGTAVSYNESTGVYIVDVGSNVFRHLLASNFIIPNGTIVRLEKFKRKNIYNGKYGKITQWVPGKMRYSVQLSPSTTIRVNARNIRL